VPGSLDVFLAPQSGGREPETSEAASDRIERIVATGDVEIFGGGTTGRGDEAIYSRENRTVTLRGSDAEVSDPESGSARGPEFVWNVDGRHVVMSGKEGRPAVSRRPLDESQD
jgi:lipopolysaccharide export system protein LptA